MISCCYIAAPVSFTEYDSDADDDEHLACKCISGLNETEKTSFSLPTTTTILLLSLR
jgi:hypothetical protein